MKLRIPGNFCPDTLSLDTAFKQEEPTRTDDSFKEQSDINYIVKTFGVQAAIPQGFVAPVYADVSEVPDYKESLDFVRSSAQEFMKLPFKLRERFSHNPGHLIEFVSDPANRLEAVKLGLIPAAQPPAPPPPPIRVEVVTPTPPQA